MIIRHEYLRLLKEWQDEQVIKVVTGLRRSGKSTLLQQFQDLLLQNGVKPEQIIALNFEELENESLLDYKCLYKYIVACLPKGRKAYIFLDEIQKVPSFEKAVDSLYAKKNTDLYLTGSNAFMLSGDLATLLTGRYIEIPLLPLSFSEYNSVQHLGVEESLAKYLKTGGLPYLATLADSEEKMSMYLEGIYNTVIVRDIEERQTRLQSIHGLRKVADISLLKTIASFLASAVGSQISVKRVADYLISSGRKISPNTVNDYMEALAEAYIFYPVERFDIVGKQLLKANKKWYMVDLGLRNYVLPRQHYDLGFSLENLVYLELKRRGGKIYIGKNGNTEVDFVVQKQGGLTYYQVSANLTAKETFERELKPLRNIKDNYPKIILTLDHFTAGSYDGIKVINLIDWLMAKK
jgi:predicted AAA+ superfamily ATPase